MVVSAQPVAPSSGIVLAMGWPLLLSRFTWKGQALEATKPSLVKSVDLHRHVVPVAAHQLALGAQQLDARRRTGAG